MRSSTRARSNELLPDWKAQGAPIDTPVTEDRFLILTAGQGVPHPELVAAAAHEQSRQLHREPRQRLPLAWRSRRRRSASKSIRASPPPKCSTTTTVRVRGVATGDMGVAKDGTHKPEYQPGMELHAQYTLFAEGCRGSLSQELMERFNLRDGIDPQKYGIGIKELWQVAPEQAPDRASSCTARAGRSTAPPAAARSSITSTTVWSPSGFVVHLNYENPHLSPYDEFQRFKTASGDPSDVRRRQAPRVRRARDQRGRPAVGAAADISRRRADRMRRGLREPAADQGLAQRDEDRHARPRRPRSPRSARTARTTS